MLLRANGSSAVKHWTIIPPSRRREASTGIGFLTTEQITPAELLRILLIRAGIETNPGPRWNCCIYRKPLNKQGSVRCSKCRKYAHYKCTPFSNASHVSYNWSCTQCTNLPPPPRLHPTQQQPCLRLLQFNCNGISGKKEEIAAYLQKHQISIAAIQETELTSKSKTPDFGSRYNFIRQDRPKNKPGGGLAFIIHVSIEFRIISQHSNEVLETQGIKVKFGNLELIIFNFYLSPKSSCPPDYQETLKSLLSHNNALLLGDANAHDPTWFSTIADTRGSKLSAEIEESEMGILNENCPTRLPSNHQPTSPDISLVTKSLLTSCDWSTEIGPRSDHLPILISISSSSFLEPIRAPKRIFINIAKSDWPAFQEEIESALRNQPGPTDVYQGEAVLRKVINTASKHHIPSGRRKDVTPQLSHEAKEWMTERDELRAREPHSPKIEELNSRIQMSIRKSKEKNGASSSALSTTKLTRRNYGEP